MLAEDEVVCYVGLLYQNKLWRVSRFSSLASAESAYRKASARRARRWPIRRSAGRSAATARQVRAGDPDAKLRRTRLATELRAEQAQREQFDEDQKMVPRRQRRPEADNPQCAQPVGEAAAGNSPSGGVLADSGQKLPVPTRCGASDHRPARDDSSQAGPDESMEGGGARAAPLLPYRHTSQGLNVSPRTAPLAARIRARPSRRRAA